MTRRDGERHLRENRRNALRQGNAGPLGVLILLVAQSLVGVPPATASDSRPVAEAEVFGEPLRIEIEAPPGEASAETLAAALREALEIEQLVNVSGAQEGGLGPLNSTPGSVPIDPRIFDALERALAFCVWSQQAHGPLGGTLNAAWGLRRSSGGAPDPQFLQAQVELAYCERLHLDRTAMTGTLEAGSQADLWGFERGLVVDRTVDVLLERGISNGFVQLGDMTRAFGPGPQDAILAGERPPGGWVVALHPGGDERIERQFVVLRDQALSLASRQVQTLIVEGEAMPPYIDQRVGQLVRGKLGVAAVTDRALDAEALSVALFVMSQREGEFRIGSLQPPPAVRWYLGSGTGFPLISERGWSALPKWKPAENPFRRE
jgi:thiamine biosynthesis lipoprotein